MVCSNMVLDKIQLKDGSQIHVDINHIEQQLSLVSITRLIGHLPIMMTKFYVHVLCLKVSDVCDAGTE